MGRRRLLGLALGAAALAGVGLLRPAAVRREAGLDVLLVTVDTLRADALGCYGRVGAETPRIDRLASGGVRFAFAHAQSVVTLPSHANILSGRYPFDHGVRENSGFRFPRGMDTLATLLRSHGYHTGAFVSAFPLDARFGLDAGFDVYDDRLGDAETTPDFRMQERPGPRTVAAARAWLDATPGPRFCWVHLYEPHAPYAPPFEWRGRVPTAYDGEVTAADTALGPLLDPLLSRGDSARTLVVLTADHGEGLGEHGEATHGLFAYESTLRVPLVVYAPRLLRPRVVTEGVRHVDILPTIFDALSLPVPAGLPGRSLLATAEGRASGSVPPSYFEALTPALTRGWAPVHGVVRDRLKYVDLPLPELYDLGGDPRETMNLVSLRPVPLGEMRSLLGRLRETDRGADRIAEDPAVQERLTSLGYVGATRALATHYGTEDDPKRNLAFEVGLQQVLERYESGDAPGALARCEQLVRDRPGVPLALRHLAVLRRRAGDLAGAVEAGRRALAADPGSAEAAAELGRALDELGRPREAVLILDPYARVPEPDLDVLMTWGAALAHAGRRDAAVAALGRAREAQPRSALAAYNLGAVHLVFGEREPARAAFEAALVLEPGLARAWNSLGLLAAEGGKTEEAVRLWERALAENPHDPDTLFNLGTLLWRGGRKAEARPRLEQFLADAPPALYAPDLARIRSWLRRG